ncbi:hypothetical protein GCM10020221_36040 [Streptomyces thioluteus]|uniref:Uncharacterized protein n=1 Tax=Streptomyces thioluteus TaxID=66431 RepID=A0ABN3X595_STRTU
MGRLFGTGTALVAGIGGVMVAGGAAIAAVGRKRTVSTRAVRGASRGRCLLGGAEPGHAGLRLAGADHHGTGVDLAADRAGRGLAGLEARGAAHARRAGSERRGPDARYSAGRPEGRAETVEVGQTVVPLDGPLDVEPLPEVERVAMISAALRWQFRGGGRLLRSQIITAPQRFRSGRKSRISPPGRGYRTRISRLSSDEFTQCPGGLLRCAEIHQAIIAFMAPV